MRFAAELKGSVPYRLQKNGNKLLFVVDNREFAQAAPVRSETLRLPVTEAPRPLAAPAVQPARLTEPVALAGPDRPSAPAAGTAKLYRGQKISLVFDNADVRSILQLIAEVSNLNIIASEEVKGTVTLRLLDVPWDQALALVLEIKGLGMISEGNVVRVMPLERINAMDEAQLTAARSKEKLETLVTEVVNVSYTDVATVAEAAAKLLTERGKITEDKRNKQIIITDIPAIFPEIRKLVRILDLPERQVLIEARIVEATTTFTRDLGVKWGISHSSDSGGTGDISQINLGLGGSFLIPPSAAAGGSGTAGLGSGITFGRLGIDSTVLDLRISALETAGDGKVISAPRVTTVNGATATIAQGTEIPYQTVDDNGKVETEFKKAELRLTVTPEINPDGTIFLKIEASNDSRGEDVPTGIGSAPAIDTKQATTKVLIRDRETTVVGGIFVEVQRDGKDGVPGLMSVPIVGHLFKSSTKRSERRELLIFITPRILD
ncbi:MAG: type IV pilus secretin PilQ [Desulfuromonadales bacterium]|nr:type IV pilus secretin PilQ [Desulfuromonadales bacterium]